MRGLHARAPAGRSGPGRVPPRTRMAPRTPRTACRPPTVRLWMITRRSSWTQAAGWGGRAPGPPRPRRDGGMDARRHRRVARTPAPAARTSRARAAGAGRTAPRHRSRRIGSRSGGPRSATGRWPGAEDVEQTARLQLGKELIRFDLDVISFGESSVPDEGAGDAGEGQEVFGFAFVAAVEAATASEPGKVRSTVQRWRPSRCEDSMPLRAIRCVRRADVTISAGERSRSPSPRGAWRACADGVRGAPGWVVCRGRGAAPDCRAGRARDPDGQGQTGPLGDQVDLRSVLAPVDRIRTCRVPATVFAALKQGSRPPAPV